jgi:hypothetical protein
VKNTLLHKTVIVFAAFCLFINGIGFSNFSFTTDHSTSFQEFVSSSNTEKKASTLASKIDLEERNLELWDEADFDEDEDDSDDNFSLLRQELIAFYINDFIESSIEKHDLKHSNDLPLYIQYNNFRL